MQTILQYTTLRPVTRPAIHRKRPSLLRKGVILQHDNAAPHKARQTVEKVAMMGRELLPHPPYSADLAASDFQPFGPLKVVSGRTYTIVFRWLVECWERYVAGRLFWKIIKTLFLHSATSTGYLFNTRLLINFVYSCTSFICTSHHPISKTLSLRQHQSVLVDGFGRPAVPATSSNGWDSNLVSAVSYTLHQPPGSLYCHHCNNSLTLTYLINGSWKLFFLNEPFLSLDY